LLQQYVPAAQVTAADTAAALAPAGTGATGYNYPILTMLLVGGTSVLLEHWNGQRLDVAFDLITRHACTVAVVVPAQLAMLVQAPAAADFTTGTLRVVTNAGAKLPAAVVDAAERLFGCKVQGIYGTSEAGATAMTRLDDANEKRRSTVGRSMAGQEVAIFSDVGLRVAPGETGEVCWRGTNKSYGFLNDPAATSRVWDDEGFLHSGDLGHFDEEGYLQIVGRKKDMIIRGGQNVNPGVIEDVLLQHPQVLEVAVVPFADEVLGERIAVCVVPRGFAPSLEDLKSTVRGSGLAAWHQPERLVLLPELPRNAGGKIDKAALSRTAVSATAALPGGQATC
jgi:non-ribosomal peptide synthetase component E (peptide arylation enzyme)